MPFDHLRYCLKDIDAAERFIKIQNIDFYKRAVGRLIAVRIEDFVKVGLRENNATLNSKSIRGDFVALEGFYENFFQTQRDKFGAHFQKLDFLATLQAWSDINLERIDFFASMARQCYDLFQTSLSYSPFPVVAPTVSEEAAILGVNKEYDIESQPNMSSDILSFTRSNSGGLLHSGEVKRKMGVLKSIEILVNYELGMLKALPKTSDFYELFAKLFISDLVSYCDNFFTRSDVQPGSPQYELGLDQVVDKNEQPNAFMVVENFKRNYRLENQVSLLRTPRNIACAHIDTTYSVAALQQAVLDMGLDNAMLIFTTLKHLYKSICFEELIFRPFALEATDPIPGIGRFIGLPITTFDARPAPDDVIEMPSFDDQAIYERELKSWVATSDDNALQYFYQCFLQSKQIKESEVVEEMGAGAIFRRHYEYRRVHEFFESKLNDLNIEVAVKVKIVELFKGCRNGHPALLGQILVDCYPGNRRLQRCYIWGIGYLVRTQSGDLLDKIGQFYDEGTFGDKYVALTSIFRCDLNSRYNSNSHHFAGETIYSQKVIEHLRAEKDPWVRSAFAMGLASIYYFDNLMKTTDLQVFYMNFLKVEFQQALTSLALAYSMADIDEQLSQINTQFDVFRFADVTRMLADLFKAHNHEDLSKRYRQLLLQGYLRISPFDTREGVLYCLVAHGAGDFDTAARVAKDLVTKKPGEPEYGRLLLLMYLGDRKFEDEFLKERQRILGSYNLEANVKAEIENMSYDVSASFNVSL